MAKFDWSQGGRYHALRAHLRGTNVRLTEVASSLCVSGGHVPSSDPVVECMMEVSP